jgi:hypothetical protein
MFVENIKQRLDALGYFTHLSGLYLDVARKVSDDDPRVISIHNFFCSIPVEGDQLKVMYNFGNMPDVAFFNTEMELIAFIKKQFPL